MAFNLVSDPSIIRQNVSLCREFLLFKSARTKRPAAIRRTDLSEDERRLFQSEDLLSADQTIIANAHGRHQHQTEVGDERQEKGKRRLSVAQIRPVDRRRSIDYFDELQFRFPLHRYCRGGVYPQTNIARQIISDDEIPWSTNVPDYHPPFYTHVSRKMAKSSFDPPFIPPDAQWNRFDQLVGVDRRTSTPNGIYQIDEQGYPLNPLGRTGLRGRGDLPRWAVNHQIHLVLMLTSGETKGERDKCRCLMKTPSSDSFPSLISSTINGMDADQIHAELKILLTDLYRIWNGNEPNDRHANQLEQIIDQLTFVCSAYLGRPI